MKVYQTDGLTMNNLNDKENETEGCCIIDQRKNIGSMKTIFKSLLILRKGKKGSEHVLLPFY